MSIYWERTEKQKQYLARFATSLGGLSVGASVGWSAPAQHLLLDVRATGFTVSFQEFGWISSALWLGMAIPVGLLANYVGRKPILISIVGIVNIIGWLLLIYAPNLYYVFSARFVQGLAVGTYCLVAPLYHAELSKTYTHRVPDRCHHEFFHTLGVFCAFVLGAFRNYHILSYGCVALPILFLVFFIWMPETPVYLLSNGMSQNALKSIEWLRGKRNNPMLEFSRLAREIEQRRRRTHNEGNIKSLMKRTTLKAFIVGICLAFIQHFTGSTPAISYTTFLFIEIDNLHEYFCTIAFGVSMVIGVLLAMRLLDVMAPRSLLIISCISVLLLNAILGVHCYLRRRKDTTFGDIAWLPIFGLCTFIFCHGLGLSSVTYYVMSKLFVPEVKTVGLALVHSMSGIFGFLSVKSFTTMEVLWGQEIIFSCYTAVAALGLCFLCLVLPKPENSTEEEPVIPEN